MTAPISVTRTDSTSDGSGLTVARWSRFGMRRLYVNTADGVQVGWVDLVSGERTLALPDMAAAFEAAITTDQTDIPQPYVPRHVLDAPTPPVQPQPLPNPVAPAPVLAPPAVHKMPPLPPEPAWTDLAGNVPGQAARARAKEELADMRDRKGAFLTFLARGLDVKTDERSWRVGADGEETVGGRLEKLRADGWHILHSVPVGNRGSDIDHVLIGPGGIYTLNTKTHPDGKIWVGKTVVKVNGRNQPYLRNSRFEADRAAKLLSAAVGWQVEVTPALVFLTGTFIPQVTIKDKPEGVIILDRLDLPRYFRRRPPRLDPSQVAHVFEFARRSSSWC